MSRIWLAAVLLIASSAQAADWVHFQVMGSGVSLNPSILGFEGGGAVLFQPSQQLPIFVGPRMQLLWGSGPQITRMDLNSGVEASIWLVNAVGVGLAGDIAFPTTVNYVEASPHFRGEPFLSVRLLRVGGVGALAARLGFPYDFQYIWGFRAGVTLQFSGS